MSWVNAVVQGLLLGGLYALFACGLSLMFGVMRIINLAHGDIAVLGAFLVWEVSFTYHVSPFVALLPVLPIMAIFGYVLQRTVLARSLRGGPLIPLLTTFGSVDRYPERLAADLLTGRSITWCKGRHDLDEELGHQLPTCGALHRPAGARRSPSWSSAASNSRCAAHRSDGRCAQPRSTPTPPRSSASRRGRCTPRRPRSRWRPPRWRVHFWPSGRRSNPPAARPS